MKLKEVTGIICLLLPSPILAGNINISNFAKIGHKPEFIEIKVNIESQCYPSYEEVTHVTNGAASKIKDIMKNYMSQSIESRDEILALPGSTTRSTKTKHINGNEIIIC